MARNNIWKAQEGDECLFKEQFELWENPINNRKELPDWYDRINGLDDDRSYVILCVTILEYQINKFLKALFPKANLLIGYNLVTKIKIIEASDLIPHHFIEMMNIMRSIRNEFAHNLEIENFEDFAKTSGLSQKVEQMQSMWNDFSDDMHYWSGGDETRLMFKDIWHNSISGLRVFESNVRLFRQETETTEFIGGLNDKAKDLKKKRLLSEKNEVLNRLRSRRK